jgi:hypothetical protein
MAQAQTLLNRQDVIDYAEYRDSFPPTAIKLIAEVERWEFSNRLGWDFYEQMLSDLTDLSGAVKYVSGTYAIGDIVIYNQRYYTAKANGVTSQPPTVQDWKETEKFESDCFNILWCEYLARYLSLCVIQNHKPTALLSMAAGHLVQPLSNDFQAPTKAAIDADLRGIELLRVKAFDNLDAYIKRVMAGEDIVLQACYDKYINLPENSTTNCGCDFGSSTSNVNLKRRIKWA